MNLQPSILDTIRSLNEASEEDTAYIIAATFNLYLESRRRLHGRALLGPADMKAIFGICESLLTERQLEVLRPVKAKPSEEEQASLLEAVEAKVGRRT